jgi:uncharacterized BrkB/YihY/UPF0761 family membrane protein
MKYISATLLLVFWMILTVLLVITFLGIIVVIDEDSDWMEFPKKLLPVFRD